MEDNKMKIEKSIYDGYIWYSDKSNPEIFQNQDFEFDADKIGNPFIIEGQLYDEQKKISYSIKFVDGKYICKKYENVCPESADGDSIVKKIFHSNRMDNLKLQFLQYWKEEDDELCEGMKVLQPKELVFVGFVKE
jgi:CRISPR type III-associated protein (TIGR04423 family)